MVKTLLVSPPMAFLITLLAAAVLYKVCSLCAFRKQDKSSETNKAYACGEDFKGHMIQPDYSQFFPFAFFFTILHVVALVVAMVPTENMETFAIAVVYVVGAVIGLFVLLRKET